MAVIDRNKVLKGLEICSTEECCGCPYSGYSAGCITDLARDALAILRPRVLTVEEVRGGAAFCVQLKSGRIYSCLLDYGENDKEFCHMSTVSNKKNWHRWDEYGIKWRCWSEWPSEEQMKKEPWDA